MADEYAVIAAGNIEGALDQLHAAQHTLQSHQATLQQEQVQDQSDQTQQASDLAQAESTQHQMEFVQSQITGQLAAAIAQQAAAQAATAAAAVAAAQKAALAAAQKAALAAAQKAAATGSATGVAPPSNVVADPTLNPYLQCVVQAESRGDYGAVSADGMYMGAFQFSQATWNMAAGVAGLFGLGRRAPQSCVQGRAGRRGRRPLRPRRQPTVARRPLLGKGTALRYVPGVDNRSAWEAEAENWVRWARTPGHDAYWYYRDAFFDLVVPAPGHRTVEVGCGEGRVTRDLQARGHRVVSVDGSTTLLRYARDADPSGYYLLADASALPLADDSADLAVAYNTLMDFDDMSGAVDEVGRVLEPGAAFCICITHPILDGGGFEGEASDALYMLRTEYFGRRPFEETVVRRGATMRFRGWSRSLENYFSALTSSGFVIDGLPRAGASPPRR